MSAWTAWAFFGKDVKLMTSEEVHENNEIVTYIESVAKWRFPPGFNAEIPALRLNLDPIFVTQRPAMFYIGIYMLNVCTHIYLKYGLSFDKVKAYSTAGQNIYVRKGNGK
jgi:hypothetical protein